MIMTGLAAADSFEFVNTTRVVPIMVVAGEPEYVLLASNDLASDVQKITGRKPEIISGSMLPSGSCVVIGTVSNPLAAKLFSELKVPEVETLSGKWESYRVTSVAGGMLAVAGSDARGTMFGLYDFIEQYVHVDPLGFWSGREPEKRSELRWDSVSIISGPPAFKFRGWFINDEDLLTEWMESGGKRNIDYPYYSQVMNREAMRAVVEALVRSRCNLIIPSSFIDILNPPEAALVDECVRRGVFVSQHHVEPMGVSAFSYFNYWKARGKDLKYSYFSHPAEVREVWRVYAEKWAKYPNVIWQLGLRGIADRPMWQADPSVPQSDADRGRLISDAMAAQVKILDEISPGQPRYLSTTLWAEGSVLNQKGLLAIPEGTIVVFADNSPGWKWQRDFHETPRNSKNTYGVYYHHGLIGSGPHLAQVVSPNKTFDMLKAAADKGAGSYAIFNVGNIREFVLGLDASAKMTWQMEGFNPDIWLEDWVNQRFSTKRPGILNAYRIYFNAYQIHDKQQVPFLMDGQIFSAGNSILGQITKKLRANKVGMGAEIERMACGALQGDAVKDADAFWSGLSDMHPASLGRRENIKRSAVQKTGFGLAVLHGITVAAALPALEQIFLKDNLLYHADFMVQASTWLEQLGLAHEALDLGDMKECIRALESADSAFGKIPALAEGYCQGKWKEWYRGCRKLNISVTAKRTHDVLELARKGKQ